MKLFILFLFTICSANIQLNITTSKFLNKTTIKFSGRDIKLVTDAEIILFNITHENLNRGVRIEFGKIPDDIFLRDPTPYEDLFKEYEWPQVQRLLTIKNAKIVEFIPQIINIKTHVHINSAAINMRSKTDMMELVENTALSLWKPYGLPKDVVHSEVNIQFGYGNWSFDDKWRDESLRSIRLPFASSKGYIDLHPEQEIRSTLSGIKIVMLIEIEYTARLVGNLILDYDSLYGKYHFYSPTIENIMRAAKLKNEIITKEYLEIRFYSDPKINVFDENTGEEMNVEVKKRHWTKNGKYNFH